MTPARKRIVRDGLVLVGLLLAVDFYLVLSQPLWTGLPADGLVYWAVDPANPYAGAELGRINSYLYSPAFAQVFAIIGRLPRDVFVLGWTALLGIVALWLARPWPAALLILFLPVSQDILVGNIHVLLAAAIVIGFRWPATWAFVLLTKATPGIGLIWFLVRREWRSLIIVGVVTGAIVLVSVATAPDLWRQWIQLLRIGGGGESGRLIPRLIVATGVCAWGGVTNRRWTVPLAAMLAVPVVWSDTFAMLLGCVAVYPWARPSTFRLRRPATTDLVTEEALLVTPTVRPGG